jgi:hypothetical protein
MEHAGLLQGEEHVEVVQRSESILEVIRVLRDSSKSCLAVTRLDPWNFSSA